MPHQSTSINTFKRALAANQRQLGLWLTLNSVSATEIVAGSGYDWLLLDMEHTCVESTDVVHHLRAAVGGTAELVVRVPSHDAVLLKRLLDAGVRSIMFPHVESADEARQVVAATRYPPLGVRGVGGNMRANNFNRWPSYFEEYAADMCVIVQLESPAGFDSIEEIAAVDGVDGLFIGPNDLAANLGFLGKPGDERVTTTIVEGLGRIKLTGKAAGILNFVPAQAQKLLESGFAFIAIGSDSGILARRSESLLMELKSSHV